ncbi:hypothetical protein FB451DRAFT_1397841 [Mycena latifolia]|nr:hypothetical protein FB451DRAFT_1397841 [Mycena latifolia]
MSYDAALAFVKRKRACAKPSPGFARALIEWEHSWRRPAVQRRFTSCACVPDLPSIRPVSITARNLIYHLYLAPPSPLLAAHSNDLHPSRIHIPLPILPNRKSASASYVRLPLCSPERPSVTIMPLLDRAFST